MALPYLYAAGISPEVNASGTLTLPANGGSVAVPFFPSALIDVQSITCRTTDTSLAHTLEVVLYSDGGEGPPMELRGQFQSFTFTATVAANRTGAMFGPIRLAAGAVYLIVRNSGVNSTTLATVPVGNLGGNLAATATIGSSLSANLGAVTWTPIASVPLIRLNGSIFGLTGGTL